MFASLVDNRVGIRCRRQLRETMIAQKSSVDELAHFGGAPLFDEQLCVGRPNLPDRDRLLARIAGILDRGWLTNNGPVLCEFERAIEQVLGVCHCIAICNGTIALEIAIRALFEPGEVIVPSFTFVATVHALQWQGYTPVFCDIDPKSHCIDVDHVASLINERTTGIMGVHLWGNACDVSAMKRLSEQHTIPVIFDAAHALSCTHDGVFIGNFGAAEVLSFHATKFLSTFEGGAIVTNDDSLAERLRLMRNFGFASHDNVIHIGTNGKMSEVCAAMGLSMLEELPSIVSVNHANARSYAAGLRDVGGITNRSFEVDETRNFQYVVLDVDEGITGVSRDQLLSVLQHENVIARRYFFPGCHRMEPYRTLYPDISDQLPVTMDVVERVLCLPTGRAIDDDTIATICQLIGFVVEHAAEINARWESST